MADPETKEVVLQIPDMGLTKDQMNTLKSTFQNHLVTTLGERAAALVSIRIKIRIVLEA
jgi:hypothetical protein